MKMRIGSTVMLAKVSEHEKQIGQFRSALRLPHKGKDLLGTEAAHQKAKAELDAINKRRATAYQTQFDGHLNEERAMQLRAEIEALNGQIAILTANERAAMAVMQEHRAEYEAEVHRLIAPACRSLTLAIDAGLANAQALFTLADEIRTEARQRGIDIDAGLLVGDGERCRKLIDMPRGLLLKLTVGWK